MGHGILLSGESGVDFTIHGVFQYSFFGHPVWITTSHVCILIVMLLLVAFAIAAILLVLTLLVNLCAALAGWYFKKRRA